MIEQPYSHICLAVTDVDRAMDDLGPSMGLTWATPNEREMAEGRVRYTYSKEGPPRIELFQGPPGSPWAAPNGSYMHHVGYWSDDMDGDKARLVAAGMRVAVDGRETGRYFIYFESDHGLRVELTDVSRRQTLEAWIAGAPPHGNR